MYIFDYDLDTKLGYTTLTIEFTVDEWGITVESVKYLDRDVGFMFDDDAVARLAHEWLKDNGE